MSPGEGRQERSPGDTPNLAARLQALAEANQVIVDRLTRQLAGAEFILDELGPKTLKGFAEPTLATLVLAERRTETRFQAREGWLTPFVGRAQEMSLLIDRFERAAAGQGQAVILSGEAGIGKSRLVHVLCERLAFVPHTEVRLQCSRFHATSTLYPVVRHLEYAAGFQPHDDSDARMRKLRLLLRRGIDDTTESLAMLAPVLFRSARGREAPTEVILEHAAMMLSPEQRETRMLHALVGYFLGLAACSPVVFVIEDAHWVDPATQEMVTQLLARSAAVRVLVVITHRSEFQTDWTRNPQVTRVTLNRLGELEGAEIVQARAALSKEIVARILRRADGVPLFIEELTRSIQETDSNSGDTVVPETLQASLLARLDRLGADIKEIAQIAAIIGREFSWELLGAVVGKPKDELAPILERLVDSSIVLPLGSVQDSSYVFRHALIQDAAYQSMLLSRRRHYHGDIGRTLEHRFPETVQSQPELVAEHYTAAAMLEQAIPYWVKAGEQAVARFVLRESLAHFERALDLARSLPESPARLQHVLNLLLLLGDVRLRHQGAQLPEALQSFAEAADLARLVGSPVHLARAALGVEDCEFVSGTSENDTVGLLEAALLGLDEGEITLRCRILGHLGRALFKQGAVERSITLARDATRLARQLGDRSALLDALHCEQNAAAGHPWSARQFPMRRQTLHEMVAIAEETSDNVLIIVRAISFAMAGYLEMGDLAGFEAQFARHRAILEKYQVVGLLHYGPAMADAMRAILHGDFATAGRLAEKALTFTGEAPSDVATGVYGVQMFTIRRERGRLAEVAPLLRRFLVENSRDSAWRPGLALIASDLGFDEAARTAFDKMAGLGFAFPVDGNYTITLCYLAEVCARLGDADRAERLYSLLLPYRDLAVVVPISTVCCGSASRYIGMLARVMGDWTAAAEHFDAALRMDRRLQAWPWLAHTKYEFALMLRARDRPGDLRRAETLLGAAAVTAKRLGMKSLQHQIESLVH
jgi:tetratricopeptide (TPR) repeat protein